MSESITAKDYTGRHIIFGVSDGNLSVLDTTTGVKYFVTGRTMSSLPRAVLVKTDSQWTSFTISKIMWGRVLKMYLG